MVSTAEPTRMTPDQRLDEIAGILTSGILRLRLKKAQHIEKREYFSLDKGNRMAPYGTPNHIDIQGKKP
ncbi:MAG: hypothetical protein G8237_02145 [Magnetococcales bacterium]|nr:hypothetical protein [Magnetococcales bacterium]